MLIGEISKLSGVKVPTIRYYETIGILPAPTRTAGKQRSYDSSHLRILSFVRNARGLGFELGTIREMIRIDCDEQYAVGGSGEIFEISKSVEERISRLLRLREEIDLVLSVDAEKRGRFNLVDTLADLNPDAESGHQDQMVHASARRGLRPQRA